jgi:hypothetical protein
MKDRNKTLTTKKPSETDGVGGGDALSHAELTQEPITQRRRVEEGRFLLQVDRQTKSSYATYETAERAALIIKRGHPAVRVVIYDTVECENSVIDVP